MENKREGGEKGKPIISVRMNQNTFGRGVAMGYEVSRALMQALEWGDDFCAVIRYSAEAGEAEMSVFNRDQTETLFSGHNTSESQVRLDSRTPNGS